MLVEDAGPGILRPRQIHGGNITRQTDAEADGIISTGTRVGIATADCLPLVLAGADMALALHVSRKSIIHGLLDNVLTYIEPQNIDYAFLGPHICEYHFSFEEEGEMLRQFCSRFPDAVHFHKGKMYVSLRKAVHHFLRAWNIHPDRISEDGRCTYELDSLPSYRRWLKEKKAGRRKNMVTAVDLFDQVA